MSDKKQRHHRPRAARCGVTGKIVFSSDVSATFRGMEIFDRFRTYRCEYCKGWHLTTKVNE